MEILATMMLGQINTHSLATYTYIRTKAIIGHFSYIRMYFLCTHVQYVRVYMYFEFLHLLFCTHT